MGTKMVVGKLNLVILAAAVGGVLWIEHANRTYVTTLTPAEVVERNAAVCPENESVPFSVDCMMFIHGGLGPPDVSVRATATDGALAESPELP
jgi:hypothetical protein